MHSSLMKGATTPQVVDAASPPIVGRPPLWDAPLTFVLSSCRAWRRRSARAQVPLGGRTSETVALGLPPVPSRFQSKKFPAFQFNALLTEEISKVGWYSCSWGARVVSVRTSIAEGQRGLNSHYTAARLHPEGLQPRC